MIVVCGDQVGDRLLHPLWVRLPIPKAARAALHLYRQARDLPTIETELHNDSIGRAVLAHFKTSLPRHRPLVWGRACMEMPRGPDEYGHGRQFRALRTNCGRATGLGYRPARLDPQTYRLARHSCYQSSTVRQGVPVELEVWPFAGEPDDARMFLAGCQDRGGDTVAVSRILVSGQLAWMRNLIGHAAHVDSGVMYLLMRFCIDELSAQPDADRPRWLLFDGYFDLAPGMRYFQERIGAEPRNVRFSLERGAPQRSRVALSAIGRSALSSRMTDTATVPVRSRAAM